MDLHHLLLAGLPAHSDLPRHPKRTLFEEVGGKVPTPAKCQNRKGAISLGRLIGERISASGRIVTILPSLSVSPRSPHPARPCAPSHPTPREPLSFRGERHIPGRRSALGAADLYRDKVARCQTRPHGYRSISKGFQRKSIAAPVSRH